MNAALCIHVWWLGCCMCVCCFISILFGPLCTKFMRCVLYIYGKRRPHSSKCVVFAEMKIVGFQHFRQYRAHTRCLLTYPNRKPSVSEWVREKVRSNGWTKERKKESGTSTNRKSDPRIKISHHHHTLSTVPFLNHCSNGIHGIRFTVTFCSVLRFCPLCLRAFK